MASSGIIPAMAKKTAAKAKTSETQEAKPKEDRRLRAIHSHLPASLAPACRSLSRHCRDIHNTAIHLAKTALDCFYLVTPADKEQKPFMSLKPEAARPKGWQEVLPAFGAGIDESNAGWAKSHAEELALGHDAKKLKLLKPLGAPDGNLAGTVLERTLFERLLKSWPDALDLPIPKTKRARAFGKVAAYNPPPALQELGPRWRESSKIIPVLAAFLLSRKDIALPPTLRPAYSRIPQAFAHACCEAASESVKTAIKSQIAWSEAPEGGKPSLPGYAARNTLPAFCFGFIGGKCFPSLAKFDLRTGEDKAGVLPPSDAKAFGGFALAEHIHKLIASRYKALADKGRPLPKPKMVRIIPGELGERPRMQLLVEFPDTHPEGSFLWELAKRSPEEWERRRKDKRMVDAWILRLAAEQPWRPGVLPKSHPDAWISEGFSAAAIDPGITNIASMGFTSGSKMIIFGGRAIEAIAARWDRKIDRSISAQTLASSLPAVSARIKARLDAKLPADPADAKLRRELSQAIHASPLVRSLRRHKASAMKAEVERLSSEIAQAASKAGVGILIFSCNKGMKNASGKGRGFNRRSLSIPHNELARRTRDKLWELGIGMAEREESGTSKASFADQEPAATHHKGAKQTKATLAKADRLEAKALAKEAKAAGKPSAQAKPPKSATNASHKEAVRQEAPLEDSSGAHLQKTNHSPSFSGTRGTGGGRSTFFRHRALTARETNAGSKQPILRKKLHADGQAALNAIAKASRFVADGEVQLGHRVMLLSKGRCGQGPSAQAAQELQPGESWGLAANCQGGPWRPPREDMESKA